MIAQILTIITPTAYAADIVTTGGFKAFVDSISVLIGKFSALLFSLLVAVFFYRIVVSIYRVGSSPKAVEDGKTLLFWGIITLFVLLSIWGVLEIFTNTFFGEAPGIPQLGR